MTEANETGDVRPPANAAKGKQLVPRVPFEYTVLEADLARLKQERDEANTRYTDALTRLDGSKQPHPPEIPAPPPPPDEHHITALNEIWKILPEEPPTAPGWRAHVAEVAWKVISPILDRQQAFNSVLVDHINRSLVVDRQTRQSIETVIQLAREQFEALVTFEWHLMAFLQRLTPYVDAADRESAALLRRVSEDNAGQLDRAIEQLEHFDDTVHLINAQLQRGLERVDGFAGGLSGVSDELAKRWESMVAREARYEARVGSLPILQQAVASLKREFERVVAAGHSLRTAAAEADSRTTGAPAEEVPGARKQAFGTLDSYKYVGFEDRFRGSRTEIAERLLDYVPLFEGASDVLDIGCGRGEFLALLRERGISGRGIDINHEMAEICRERGFDAEEGDALAYLESLPDASLGGILAAQVIEHLDPSYLIRLLDVAYHKLRAGSSIILETINPACWFAFFESYIRDITHVRPIHPDTLKYLLQASGFQTVDIQYRAPFPEEHKLQHLPDAGEVGATFNANVDTINRLLFTYLDYAAVGKRA